MDSNRMQRLKSLSCAILKIGLIGFGGGSALIPLIQKKVVEEAKLITPEKYEEAVMIANVTPGALPVELSAAIGRSIAGWKGMLLGAIAMALPGVLLTILFLSAISYVNEDTLNQIQYASVGIAAFIVCLLADYVCETVKKGGSNSSDWKRNRWIVLVIFAVTSGKNVAGLLGIEEAAVIALSNIQVFSIIFMGVFVWQCVSYRKHYTRVCVNQAQSRLRYDMVKNNLRQLGKELSIFSLMMLIAFIVAFAVKETAAVYLWNGFWSSVISFGGGDSYLTVAEGLFVSTDLITEYEFYGQLIPLVNVLPGSILCKTLSGIGFYLGLKETGSLGMAYIIAAAGFICSVFASCSVISVGYCIYGSMSKLAVFFSLRRWMRPIVAGMMLNVILELMVQNGKVDNLALTWMLGICGLDFYLLHIKQLGNGKVVLLSLVCAVILCNMV